MSRNSMRRFLKLLIPFVILLSGCTAVERVNMLIRTRMPAPTSTSTVAPPATATPTEPTATATLPPTQPPEQVVTPTAEVEATPTPTPTPTPGPYHFYLNAYRPQCTEGEVQVDVRVVDHEGVPLPDITMELLNGFATPVATAVSDGEGHASLAVSENPEGNWGVAVSDASGGGAIARSVEVELPTLGCTGPYSLAVEFQRRMPENVNWPERQPITMDYPPRESKEGPWSPEHVRPLHAWPRPPHDTGMGIHFLPIGYYADWVVDLLIEHMKELHMTWTVVLYNDDNALRIAAERFRNAGIMVVWRPNLRPDANYIYLQRDLEILREVGMPPYIQLFNEPEVAHEWGEGEDEIKIKHYADNWIKFADEVYALGGFPGVQVVDPATLEFLINRIKEKGKEHLFNEMFFVPHPYGSNHPPDYPYDANMQAREPGKTAYDDWFGALGFLKYARIYQEQLGFVPPFIIGEGGWAVTVHEDDKYPPVNLETHRDWHLEVFSWFKNGSLSNGEPLPDYLFAFCPWVIASGGEMVFDQASWYQSEQSGTKSLTIKAMRRMPPFERRFSWQ